MEELEACVLFPSPKQQETQRLRERNRIAKRASRARQRQREQHSDTTADVAVQPTPAAETTSQDLAQLLHPPQHTGPGSGSGSGSGSDSACLRAEASEDLGVWALDGPLDDPTALPWPSSLDEDWPGFSGSLVDTLSPRQLSVPAPAPGISNPEPRAPPASSSSLTSDSNSSDLNSRPSRLLHIAARNGTTGILLSLIKAGADVNSRDCSGTTPLHIAVRFRRGSALELLVNHGANINARDSANMTALEVAVRAEDEELVNVLLSGGAELH